MREMFGPPLLRLDANNCRYFIARHLRTGDLSFVDEPCEGGGGSSALFNGAGASDEPFEEWVMAGRLPSGSRRLEIELDIAGPHRIKSRSGLWMAAVPWHGREAEGEVRFIDRQGEIVTRLDIVLSRKTIRRLR